MGSSRALIFGLGLLAVGAGGAVLAQSPPQAPAEAPPAPTPPAPAAPAAPPSPAAPASPADLSQLLPAEPAPAAAEAPPPAPAQAEAPPAERTPLKRTRYGVAVIQALDKVTAETIRFEAPVGQPIRYKSLIFTVRACELTAADEPAPDAVAYMTIDSQPQARPGRPAPPARQAYRGWMYAASPGLHPLEHPVYDAWLVTCRAAAPASGG